jgi:hypothetical protein
MKLSKLNESLTLLANIGVIAGILFLAIEIRQNTQMMKAQTRDGITDKQLAFYEFSAGSQDNAEIYTKGTFAFEELEPNSVEFNRYRAIALANYRIWENEWYQYQQGLFELEEFEPRMNMLRNIDSNSGYRNVWELVRMNFAPGFREFLDSELLN